MNRTVRTVLSILTAAYATCSSALPQKAVIFDIGNVLSKSDSLTAFRQAGLPVFAWYFGYHPGFLQGASSKVRRQVLYPFLRKLQPDNPNTCAVFDEWGERMPQIMVSWMTGERSCDDIRAACIEKCALYSSWFASAAERDLVCALTTMMFTPHRLAQTQRLIAKTVNFVRACKKAGFKVYVLSNFDAATYAELIKKDPDFFNLFDGKIISGQCGLVKPDPAIYQFLLNVYQLDPRDCFFIDDIMQNVHAAQDAGMTAAQCLNGDIDTIKPAFHAWRFSHAAMNDKGSTHVAVVSQSV